MSFPSSLEAPASSFPPGSILDVALSEYRKNTGKDLLSHPLAIELQRCDSADGILAILQRQANTVEQLRDGNPRLMKWISSSVHILYSFSGTLGDGVSLAFPPAKPIFTGIGVLLAAAKDVSTSHDVLLDLFRRIEDFFKRFKLYSQSFVNAELAEVLVQVVVKVLNILSIATKEMEQSRTKRYLKKLAGSNKVEDALAELEKLIQGEHYMVTAQVLKDTSGLKHAVQQMANKGGGEERKKIRGDTRRWFSPPEPSINHNIAWNLYHDGSATWLFEHSVFIDWMSTGSLLWVHGKPGSGKSIICSAIIQHIIALCGVAGQASIVYFYFDFRDKEKQNSRNLVNSLLIQLSDFSDLCCDIIHRVHSAHGNGTRQPTDDVLKNCLKEMLMVIAERPIYIVMDALDECPDSGLPSAREEVLVVLKELVGLHLPNLRICVTSRPEVDIKSILNQLTIHAVSLHDESEQKKGIADYVSSIVNSDVKMREWPEEDKELVIEVLSERADGMFRWVVCQLETLRRSAQRNLRGILDKLPKTLDETYERVLKDINEDNREHARRLLHCLAVAIRPLRVEELAEILAFDFDDAQGGIPKFRADWRWKDQEDAVLSTCSSLIAVVDGSVDYSKYRVVQFSHFSVKEFLTSDRLATSTRDVSRYHILPGPAHTILAQACLGFLLHFDTPTDWETGMRFPLAWYAAQHWVAHAQSEDVASRVRDGMQSLFDPDKRHLVTWLSIYNMDTGSFGKLESPQDDIPNPLYHAALCGFHDLVEHLVISYPQLINNPGGCYGSPMLAALSQTHTRVAEFLLRHGAEVDDWGEYGQRPLQAIIDYFPTPHVFNVVSFLLKHGANVNFRGSNLYTPLHTAAMYQIFDVVRFLLERGADIDSRDYNGTTVLHMACGVLGESEGPDVRVMQLLLEHGANVNAQDDDGDTPFLVVAYWGEVDAARFLLEHGAEPNMENNHGQTAMHLFLTAAWASPEFYPGTFVRFLLEHGVNANDQDMDHTTPLHLAMKRALYDVVQILLEHGADPNVANKDGKTPLCLVFDFEPHYYDGHDAEIFIARAAQLLLHRGVDMNAQGKGLTTPLLLAIQLKMYDLTRVLLAHGADPNVKNDDSKTPLHLLIEADSSDKADIPDVARLLLDRGADVNAQDQNDATPLLLAVKWYMDDVARILLERGADPNVKNNECKTPLHLLLERGCDDHGDDIGDVLVVGRLLLERGADVNAQDEGYTTPLYLAYNHNTLEIAQIILDHVGSETDQRQALPHITLEELAPDVPVNAQNKDLAAHLHSACHFGRLDVARELLDDGADPNAENIRGETSLHVVSRGQHNTGAQKDGGGVVQLLLGRGANVNAQDKGHITPLHLASYYGRLEIVRVLLYHGARVNAKDDLGQTALHLVLEGNRGGRDCVRIVRLLLENGADVNAEDGDNETPLHLASSFGKLAIGRVLLIHGANANAANFRGQTPLHVLSLCPWGVEDEILLVRNLVDGGADVNARDRDHETPLHTAYRNNRLAVTKHLLDWDADEDAKNNKGQTPSQLAP